MMDYKEYKEMLMNDMDLTGVDMDSIDEFCKQTVAELAEVTESELAPEEIIQNTGLNALKTAGLIAAGLAVTHVTMKYVVPFATKKVKELKEKKVQKELKKQHIDLDEVVKYYQEELNEVEDN